MAILIPDKTAFRAQNIAGDKEKGFVMMKGSIRGEDKIILDVYATNSRASRYTEQKLIEPKRRIRKGSQLKPEWYYLFLDNCHNKSAISKAIKDLEVRLK